VRIVFVIGSLRPGGSERQAVELATGMRRRGHEVAIVCLNTSGPLEAAAEAAGVAVITLGLRMSSPALVARGAVAYAAFLRRFRPDVVYGFLFWGGTVGLLGAALVAPRAVRVSGRRSDARGDAIPDHPVLTRWIRRLVNRITDVAIANARAAAATHVAEDPRLAGRMVVVRNAVHMPTAPRDRHPGRIVCVANLRSVKRHADLLAAVALLPPTVDWELRLVGDGPLRGAIEIAAGELPEPGRVTLLGSRPDVEAVIATAAVLVLASQSEGMPNAVMEAMAAGVPVVATAVGAVPELLASGAGTVVPVGDAAALAAALAHYLGSPADAETAGRAGIAEARRYGADVAVERHLAIFEGLRRRRRA
jgi:glycosyltransferase involved in cell wall biosynthesis